MRSSRCWSCSVALRASSMHTVHNAKIDDLSRSPSAASDARPEKLSNSLPHRCHALFPNSTAEKRDDRVPHFVWL